MNRQTHQPSQKSPDDRNTIMIIMSDFHSNWQRVEMKAKKNHSIGKYLRLALLIGSLSSFPSISFAKPVGSQTSNQTTEIPMNLEQAANDLTVEESVPLPETIVNPHGQIQLNLGKRGIVSLAIPPKESDSFRSLSEGDKQKFFTKRINLLQKLAAILSKGRNLFGLHGIIKKKYYHLRGKVQTNENPVDISWIAAQLSPFSREGLRGLKSVLDSIDQFLFNQARLFVDATENGFVIGVGPILEAGAAKWGYGGAVSLFISVGYNTEEQAVVVDIARGSESFRSSLSFFLIGGLNVQAGIYLASKNATNAHDHHLGQTFYPPGTPAYLKTTSSGQYVSAGFSSTYPPVGGDLFTWTNAQNQTTVLRFLFSKSYPGFVRWTWGGMPDFGLAIQKVSNLVKEVAILVSAKTQNLAFARTPLHSGSCQQTLVGGRYIDIQ